MISAFGAEAERCAALMGDVDAIVTEPSRLADAYLEAVRRRVAGERFYGMLLLGENRDRTMSMLAPAVLSATDDPDYQRSTLSGIGKGGVKVNGKAGSEWLAEPDLADPTERAAAAEFLLLCPALLVRSLAEYQRVSALRQRPREFELIVLEPNVPRVERRPPDRPGTVIWAPERGAAAVTLHAFALAEMHGDVTLVSADGIVPQGSTATAYRAGDPRVAEALATATCVVVPNPTDPGAAVAFARQGYGVVAPFSAGAHEFAHGVELYDPAIMRGIHVAATMALARPASLKPLPPCPPRAPLAPALPVSAADAPPATIIIPTFNRRDDLARCLAGVGSQTYPNTHALVVNDCGEAVGDVVARFPFARLLDLEKNVGVSQACMDGLALVDDGFVVFHADDDLLYPDHIECLASALLRTGAGFAHANTLIRYVERTAAGTFSTTGFNCATFTDTTTPAEALVATPVSGQSVLWRRSIFREIGGWLVESMLSDQEIQMRAHKHYALAYVDQITSEWRVHGGNFSGKVNAAGEQRRIFEVVHPTPGRAWLTKTRDYLLSEMANRPPGYVFPPTFRIEREAD